MMLVVLDTNVIVSALIKETGNPSKILDLVINNQIQLAYDNRIMGEYEEVLSRQELHISQSKSSAVIRFIELTGCYVEAESFSADGFPDQNDMPFVEVFITSNAQALVTGNFRHFLPLIDKGLLVVTPSQFIEKYFSNQ
jgi:putative PIN family toxin of toxin-antitoxin system